ncbi:uncharacterized protein (DUF983 family) [Ochrobactrum daejeonense]|uniref:Uncharacterized protein (DUF983 family) n=1 Tax=Brucella daejeonensis TaxID=659015 RepID=A0A7W9AY84_9HYPH|nr:DUF983 domain-containing protein [Brucella daejeonensis]MBB5702768.1 uncharacterized protein (DUF983 family) [Brucella daejeonensis]
MSTLEANSTQNVQVFGMESSKAAHPKRALGEAMWRGFRSRCPHCGEGKLFRAFVKPVAQCSVCNEDYTEQRADDLPAYLTILIVGHIVVGAFMGVEATTNLPLWAHMAIWGPLTVIMSLLLLQPIKGATIGLQWALYMHGFGGKGEGEYGDVT